MAINIAQIVNALRISRSEFGRIFVQAQMALVENGDDRQPFEAVSHSGIDQKAFTEALTCRPETLSRFCERRSRLSPTDVS